jgi:hypothetical protein
MERVLYGEDGRILNFNVPTQVKYLDADADEGDTWIGGIGYNGWIICGCCGGLIDIDEIYEAASWDPSKEGIAPIIVYDDWVDISENIAGELKL